MLIAAAPLWPPDTQAANTRGKRWELQYTYTIVTTLISAFTVGHNNSDGDWARDLSSDFNQQPSSYETKSVPLSSEQPFKR